MTEHNWKPGDLAMSSQGSVFAIETERGVRWVYDDGSGGHENARMSYEASVPSGLRPLVVIDPEDREQVERLAADFMAADDPLMDPTRSMQAALREFAAPTPPKPDEPQGLGAVAEDAEEVRWLAVGALDGGSGPFRWARNGAVSGRWREWADIDVVRVLSEGVVA